MFDSIGKRIKAAREAIGLSQKELGDRMGVDQSSVALWEKDRTTPRHDKIDQLSRIVLLTPEYILFGSSPESTPGGSVPVIGYIGASDIIHRFPLKKRQMMPSPPSVPGRAEAPTHAVIVLGNDLWPVYRNGDVLFFSETQCLRPQQASGLECIVETKSGDKLMKRILPFEDGSNGAVILSSYQGPEMVVTGIKRCMPVTWTLRASALHSRQSGVA